ncbi:hypothetical protein BD769DRAFT_828597 [Suillus cothurnatus]|nr:hypothetical protein BD769DRAFT_828597 [Suillus cothurnatus]
MRFASLVALAVVASTVPSLAAPAPYSYYRVTSERDTASTDDNTVTDTSALHDFVNPRIGTVILPGAIRALNAKRDTTSDIIQAIEAAFDELSPGRKRDVTADITAALQTLLQEGGSLLSTIDTKREVDSILPVEERGFTIPKISSSTSNLLSSIGSIISLGVSAGGIADAFSGSNSTRRDLDQTSDGVDVGGDLGIEALQLEDRSFSSVLGKAASLASAGNVIATVISALDGSSNSTKRELDTDSGRVQDQRRAISSDIENILQVILEGVDSTSTSTKRSTSDNDFLGLTDIITPEQLDELS